MANPTWMNDVSLKDISKVKLDFLQKLVFESEHLTKKEQMPFLFALASRTKKEKIQFSQDEISRIVAVLKRNATPEEAAKMDKMLKVFQSR